MHIAVMSFLSLCYGLSFWDYKMRLQYRVNRLGLDAAAGLPLVCNTAGFKILKLVGASGFLWVGLLYWSSGFETILTAIFVFFVVGTLIGVLLPRIIDRLSGI